MDLHTNTIYNADYNDIVTSLPDESVDLILTDPPYLGVLKDDWDQKEAFTPLLIRHLCRILKSTGNIYVWCGIGEKSRSLVRFMGLLDAVFTFKDLITWKNAEV